jgi:hypothetical protein
LRDDIPELPFGMDRLAFDMVLDDPSSTINQKLLPNPSTASIERALRRPPLSNDVGKTSAEIRKRAHSRRGVRP